MKKTILLLALAMLVGVGVHAASWNDAFGIGGGGYGSPGFSGSGQTLAVIPSVRSNTVYYITSATSPGAPFVERVSFKTDQLSATVDFWNPTNTLTIASNGSAGDTTLWLVASNVTGGNYTTLA